ncbi:MAG: GNAT family N-acetyltransferase [Candidatus Omnitrophica bacterium]|nr:GNAT family N-acetyltransferase [Candidatus Omnitrophota bacterium]
MPEIFYKIYDNIGKIDKGDWDVVFGDIPESYPFYKTLGNSALAGFDFYYLVIYCDNQIMLIAPLFCADFNLDIAVEGLLAGVVKQIRRVIPRFLILKTLFCGSPFGEYGTVGVREEFRNNPVLIPQLLAGIKDLALKLGAPLTIFKDFLKDSTLLLDDLVGRGFIKVESFPAVFLDLSFPSFEGYLKSLGSSTRKNLNKKLKQAYARGNIEIKTVRQVDSQIDQIIRLYENTYHKGSTKFERLNKKFFLQVCEDLSPHTRFFLYYVDGCLAAFNLCFAYKDLLIDKFIGFNYDISSRYNLYFVSWAHNIKWCIDNSLRYYYPGQTDYEPKIRLGGKIVPLYAYLKHKNVFFNLLLKLLALFLKPDNFNKNIRS